MMYTFMTIINQVFGGWIGYLTLAMFIISLYYCTEKN